MASLVAAAVLSISGSAAWLHVHAYGGHDHAEHHHGPAAHGHAPVTRHHPHGVDAPEGPEMEPCSPAEHVLAFEFTSETPVPLHAPVPEAGLAFVLPAPLDAAAVVRATDVRAHSPPRLTDAPLRAPPVIPAV